MAASNENSTSRDVLRFLIFGFIGGFILNLMPCVLPVISLKIFGFVQQAGQSRARIFRSGLAFIAGIFAWFLGLALVLVIIKSAGGQPVWAAQFTNPYFVLFMSAVVLVFALNLFGVFEINLPQWLNRRAVAAEGSVHGDAGSFFQGVFATVLATPCTAPFLGTALGFAFTQSATVILLMFGSIALGMSAPYFLLSAQPAWLKFLPKPGPWMVRVKQFMGFFADRDSALFTFRARRPARRRGSDLDLRFSSCPERRLLAKGRIRYASRFRKDPRSRARAHARARNRQRDLFHRRQIPKRSCGRQPDGLWYRLGKIYARTTRFRT
jgi:cytochrome c biogenesis protein CcdA